MAILKKEPVTSITKKDINNKLLELGHIVIVKYVWSTYVGIIRKKGLSLYETAKRFNGAAKYHDISKDAMYQVLGHVDTDHIDFNNNIITWINSEFLECPIKIKIRN